MASPVQQIKDYVLSQVSFFQATAPHMVKKELIYKTPNLTKEEIDNAYSELVQNGKVDLIQDDFEHVTLTKKFFED